MAKNKIILNFFNYIPRMSVLSAGQFLHSINVGEFLDSPEWESSTPKGQTISSHNSNNCNGNSANGGGGGGGGGSGSGQRKPSLGNNFIPVNTATRYELFDGTTGQTGKETFEAPVQRTFNITLVAATVNVQYVVWERPTLEYYLAKTPFMGAVLGLLMARDITNKLYQMNQKVSFLNIFKK